MTQFDKTKMHPAALMYANEEKAGKLSRREFLTRTTSLGLTATAAYGLLGLASPVKAAAHAQQGGEVRIAMTVYAPRDPRTYDGTEVAYVSSG